MCSPVGAEMHKLNTKCLMYTVRIDVVVEKWSILQVITALVKCFLWNPDLGNMLLNEGGQI